MKTTTDTITISESWKQRLDEIEQSLNGKQAKVLQEYRRQAIQKLKSTPFPDRKSEDWKYTYAPDFVKRDYHSPEPVSKSRMSTSSLDEKIDACEIPFVNGNYAGENIEDLRLPEGVRFYSLNQILDSGHQLNLRITRLLEKIIESSHPFQLYNLAHLNDGYVIYLPKNAQPSKKILFTSEFQNNSLDTACHPLLVVIAEESASCRIVEHFIGGDQGDAIIFHNYMSYYFLEANARISKYNIQDLPLDMLSVNITEVEQQCDSVFHHFTADVGGKVVRNNVNVLHMGQNIESYLYGISIVGRNQHIDNQSFIDHAEPNCHSNELYKNVVKERGTAVFNGKIIVRQDAQKTNAFQQNSNLVLHDTATVNAKPQLEIFADDVKCSHGATTGQLDNETIFYLMSRGLNRKLAEDLLKEGFLAEVLENISDEHLRDYILELISVKL